MKNRSLNVLTKKQIISLHDTFKHTLQLFIHFLLTYCVKRMIFWMRTNIRAVSSATVFYTLLVFLTQIADCKHIAFGRRIFDSCKTKSKYLVHFKLVLKLIWISTIIGTIEKLFNLQSNWYNFVLFIHNIKTMVFQCLFMTTNFSG